MRKIFISIFAAIAAISPVFSENFKSAPMQAGYITLSPKGQIRNFTIVIPAGSKVIYADGMDETTYTITSGKGKIKLRALYSTDADQAQRIREKKWELRDIDPSTRTIIDGEPVTIRSSIKGTLHVYQFKDIKKKGSVIQRTIVASQGNFSYIIDCYAPIEDFYRYEQAFNIAMGGFMITGTEYTPAAKRTQNDGVDQNKTDIKIDQNELNSMGLKEETREDQNQQKIQTEAEQK